MYRIYEVLKDIRVYFRYREKIFLKKYSLNFFGYINVIYLVRFCVVVYRKSGIYWIFILLELLINLNYLYCL